MHIVTIWWQYDHRRCGAVQDISHQWRLKSPLTVSLNGTDDKLMWNILMYGTAKHSWTLSISSLPTRRSAIRAVVKYHCLEFTAILVFSYNYVSSILNFWYGEYGDRSYYGKPSAATPVGWLMVPSDTKVHVYMDLVWHKSTLGKPKLQEKCDNDFMLLICIKALFC